MTKEQEKKAEFVERYLAPAIKAANPDVINVRYMVLPEGVEVVNLTYKDHINGLVNVSADSLNALVRDVFRKLD